MTRFASRDLSFVALSNAEMAGEVTDNTQQCAGADGKTSCTCCTNDTSNAKRMASDADLTELLEQLATTTH
jgi:hypothetical protein